LKVRLIRDVLDNQLVGRKKVKIGKADGIVIEIREGGPPKILSIEAGLLTKARRIHPAVAAWIGRWSTPYRIGWSQVRDVGIDIDVDIDAENTPLLKVEKRLRKVVMRLPFA
jgi:hypothetical protein